VEEHPVVLEHEPTQHLSSELQEEVISVLTHPVDGSQESAVHLLLSSQSTGVLAHLVLESHESLVHAL